MSFNYLPPNVLIVLLFLISGVLFYYSKTRIHVDDKLTAVGYFLWGTIGVCEAIDKIMCAHYGVYISNQIYILILSIVGFIGFILIAIGGWPRVKDDPVRRKALLVCFVIIIFSLIAFGILIYMG